MLKKLCRGPVGLILAILLILGSVSGIRYYQSVAADRVYERLANKQVDKLRHMIIAFRAISFEGKSIKISDHHRNVVNSTSYKLAVEAVVRSEFTDVEAAELSDIFDREEELVDLVRGILEMSLEDLNEAGEDAASLFPKFQHHDKNSPFDIYAEQIAIKAFDDMAIAWEEKSEKPWPKNWKSVVIAYLYSIATSQEMYEELVPKIKADMSETDLTLVSRFNHLSTEKLQNAFAEAVRMENGKSQNRP